MKLSRLIMIGLLIIWSCGKQAPPIPQAQIVDVLMDIHIAEALINGHHPAAIKDSLQRRYLAQVLDKWKISEEAFEGAMDHMHSDPDYMRDVYDAVLAQVNDYSSKLDDDNPLEGDAEEIQKLQKTEILK